MSGTGLGPEIKAGLLEVMIEKLRPSLTSVQLQDIYGLVNENIPWGDDRCNLRQRCEEIAAERGWVLEDKDEQDPLCT